MLTKYHKNAVMHGCLDYFCLACETHLKTDDDVNLHIDKPVHKKNLGLALYVDSCLEDRIRKVNKRYYCECCNMLLPTMTKVNLHIKDDKHDFNRTDETEGEMKKSVFLRWIRNSVIAFDDLLINEKAWNGFVDDTCVICESEFDDAAMHRSEVGHLLKMIQAKVQVGSDNFISRKIDDTSFQCLTCNNVISHGDMITHSDKTEHTKRYLECRKAKRALVNNNETKEAKKDQNKKEEAKKEETIKEEVKNKETKKEEPKKEEPKTEEPEIKKVKKEEAKKKEVKKEAPKKEEAKKEEAKKEDPKKDSLRNEELKKEKTEKEESKKEATKKENKKLAKKDADKKPAKPEVIPDETKGQYEKDLNEVLGTHQYLKFLPGNMSALCIICDWSIDVFSISQHVKSQHHLTLLKMQEEKANEIKKAQMATKTEVAEVKVKEEVNAETNQAADEENKSKIIDSIQTFQKRDILIDLISEKAFCKKCSANVKYVFEDIEKHIEEHKNNQTKTQVENYPTVDKSLNKIEVKRPEPEKPKPVANVAKPAVNDTKPAVNDIKPAVNDTKPAVNDTKPAVNDTKHAVNDAKAVSNGAKPIANDAKTVVKDTKPDTKDTKPAATAMKTAAKETKQLPIEDIQTYAKNNEITYNKTHSKAYCRLCETKVPSTFKCLQEHVEGNNHQMKKKKEVTEVNKKDDEDTLYETKTMEDYMQTLIVVENLFRHDCVINDDICVNVASFMMLTKIDRDRVRCQVCEKTMLLSEINDHKDTKRHEKFMKTTKVLHTIDDEFVREVRPGIFHCGFCNLVEAGWAGLQHHLRSYSHKQIKQGCEWMLQEHLPAVREHRMRKQQAEFMFIMRMLMGRALW